MKRALTSLCLLLVACTPPDLIDDGGLLARDAGTTGAGTMQPEDSGTQHPMDAARPDAGPPPDAGRPPLPTGQLVIGTWCGPPIAHLNQARFDEVAAAGFTHISNPCEPASNVPSYNLPMLAYGHDAGLQVIVSDNRAAQAVSASGADRASKLQAVANEYKNQPGLYGYHVFDEPNSSLFPALGAVREGLEALDPAHPVVINLLPTYASLGQLGSPSYDAHVASFLQTVQPTVFSYDHYNFYTTGDGADFFDNLAIVRRHSVRTGIPFWQYIQALKYVAHRDTTGPEKRWAAMHTVAYGGTGVMYFTYWTPPQSAEAFGEGLITLNGAQTVQYAQVRDINKSLAAIGRYVAPAKSTGVFHTGTLESSTVPRAPGQPVYVPTAAPVTVGLFESAGDVLALLVNRNYRAPVEFDAWVASADGQPEVLDNETGKFVKATVLATDAEKGAKLHFTVAPGDGVLVHLVGPVPMGAKGAEAFVGTVRGDQGFFSSIDSAVGGVRLRGAGWGECPTGYVEVGRDFQANGFWLCARSDLSARTFYFGNVVGDQGAQYRVTGGAATRLGSAGWDTCAGGTALGRVFDSNGFWLCMQ